MAQRGCPTASFPTIGDGIKTGRRWCACAAHQPTMKGSAHMTLFSATVRSAPTKSLKQLLTSYPLAAFFVLAFAGSWLIALPFIMGQQGIGLFPYTLSLNWLWLMPFTGPT